MRRRALLRMLQYMKGETMEDQTPNHASTPAEIVNYYDRHLNLTLRELSAMTGRTIPELKRLIMGIDQ